MKKNWINFIKFSCFSIITALILILLNIFVFIKVVYTTPYVTFYAQKSNSLDFVAIGNSTVGEGISPCEIWNTCGLTGCNISASPTHPEVIIIAIEEVARLQSPKLIYVDLNGLTYQKFKDQERFVINYVDVMPDGDAKNDIILKYDYLQDKDLIHSDDGFELFKYHNEFRNSEYFTVLFSGDITYLKGFRPIYSTEKQKKLSFSDDIVEDLPDDGLDYLYRILDVCKKFPDINFLFGKMPRFENDNIISESYKLRSAIPIINEYGYEYVEWDKFIDDIGLNENTDMRDENHMNVRGAIKFSKFLGKYMIENYALSNIIHDKNIIDDFNDSYQKYSQNIKKRLD